MSHEIRNKEDKLWLIHRVCGCWLKASFQPRHTKWKLNTKRLLFAEEEEEAAPLVFAPRPRVFGRSDFHHLSWRRARTRPLVRAALNPMNLHTEREPRDPALVGSRSRHNYIYK